MVVRESDRPARDTLKGESESFRQTVAAVGGGQGPHLDSVQTEVAEGMGVDVRKLPLAIGIFGAEPWSDAMRRDLEARLGIMAVDLYGLSEIIGPGVAIGEGVIVKAFSHIEGARIDTGAQVGPYARLRPGAEIGERLFAVVSSP